MYTSDFRYFSSNQKTPFFLAHYSPAAGSSGKAVILVPPFAEELNRSKRMYVLCAQRLAGAGLDAYCFDFVGTGDSYGEWGSFSWADWQQNLVDVYEHIRASGVDDISVIALRLAALLVAETVASRQIQLSKCLLWDPVEDGEVYVRQLLRLKIAAAMTEEAASLTTKDVLASIEQHGFLEVGGYRITAELLDSIKQTKLTKTIEVLMNSSQLHWMVLKNTGQSNTVSIPLSVPKALQDKVILHAVQDTRFWMQQEVTIAPALLQKTSELFTNAG